MKYLEYYGIRLLVGLFSKMPFPLIYVFSDVLCLMLHRILRYRYAVVMDNLRQAFPDHSEAELKGIARGYYRNLCDITLETFRGITMPSAELRRRYRLTNAELLSEAFERGQSILVMGSHFTNWEWGALAISLSARHEVIGIYKPLRNPLVDAYFRRRRGQWGLHLRTMNQTNRALVEFRRRPAMFCLIADQTPSNARQAHWLPFLNRQTPFLAGADKIARRTGYPVYYFDTRRVGRGFYEVTFSELCSSPAETAEGEITARYARRLEAIIREEPPYWLWSHRRWKRQHMAEKGG